MSAFKNYLLNLNLFKPNPDSGEIEDEKQGRVNIFATRVYLAVLPICLIFLGTFLYLSIQITTITLKYPSKEQFDNLPHDAECYCSRISLSFGEFTSLQPIFHQICSSEFVTDRWINAMFVGSNSTYFYIKDFRTFGSAQFQALAGFCYLSKAYFEQSKDSFYQKTFISSEVSSESALKSQIQSAIYQFQQTAPRTFTSQLGLIQRLTTSNRLTSGLQTNQMVKSEFNNIPIISYVTYDQKNGSTCDCMLDFQCTSEAVFDDTFGASTQYFHGNMKVLLGLSSGCLPVNSILASTLECFYNQTCLNDLISFFPTSETFSAMHIVNHSRFGLHATVQSMVNNLMIEDWIIEISYEKYYDTCAPISCSYLKEVRFNTVFTITKMVSLLSGLTLLLELIIPKLVQFIVSKLNKEKSPQISFRDRWQQLKSNFRSIITELNTFKRYPSNERQIRFQRYATRLYILLLVISTVIFIQYQLLRKSIHRQTISNVSISDYIQLEELYPTALSCPCTNISIPYSNFISIQANYHQVCSSYLISPTWIMYSNPMLSHANYIYDYRLMAANQFQTLAMLCEQSQKTISDELDVFLQTQIVSPKVILSDSFKSQMRSLIEDWKASTISQFLRTMRLIRITTLTNQLMNRLNIFFQTGNREIPITEPRTYSACNCAFSQACHTSTGFYVDDASGTTFELSFRIPNFFVGCYLFEALLQSTLECFYNRSCMIEIDNYLDSSLIDSLVFPALDENLNAINETIESIVNQLMVNSWSQNINFTSYYRACAPSSCILEYYGIGTIFNAFVSVLGIFGGLSIGFKVLIVFGLRLSEKFFNKFSLAQSISSIKHIFNCTYEHQLTRRLHITLVIVILQCLYVLNAFNPQSITVEKQNPSLSVYEDLAKNHSDTLRCVCSEISIEYKSFLSITASYHPVCLRDFFADIWAVYLNNNKNSLYENVSITYIYSATSQLQALSVICQLSQDTVSDSLSQLLASHMISNELLSPESLSQRIETTINDFRISITKLFTNTFSLIRETTKANRLMTTFGTNWIFTAKHGGSYLQTLHTVPVIYGECNCASSSKCFKNVDGVILGCYVVEAMLQSTFECLYDQECMDKTHTYRPLNTTVNPSRFQINSTIETIFNELMIEELSSNLSYTNYYEKCLPSSCSFSYVEKINLVEGMTTLISLYGGLMIICQLISVIVVQLLKYRSTDVFPTTVEYIVNQSEIPSNPMSS